MGVLSLHISRLCSRYVNHWIIFFVDKVISGFVTAVSLLFVSYRLNVEVSLYMLLALLASTLAFSALGALLFKSHIGVVRHTSMTEVGRFVGVALIKSLGYATVYVLTDFSPYVLSLCVVLDVMLTFFLQVSFRVFTIFVYKHLTKLESTRREKMLIYLGSRHELSAVDTIFDKLQSYKVDGYLKIGNEKSMRISGSTVFSVKDQESFDNLIEIRGVTSILFAGSSDLKDEKERLVRFCEKAKVKMLLLPPFNEVVDGKATFTSLPQVRIEDLLGREEIKLDMEQIASSLEGKVIMVTGAAGSIGSEICRQLCCFKIKKLVLFDCAETPMHTINMELQKSFPCVDIETEIGNVSKFSRVDQVMQTYMPQVIFHAAAYKHVPMMERNPCEAIINNVMGTMILSDLAVRYDVERFVMVSTDKAVNPTNVMGASKRLAEIYVQSLSRAISLGAHRGHTKFITTRFGNVLGSNGSVIPYFRQQLENGGPITVTHPEIIRYFMTIPEACSLVLEAATMGEGNEIFVFDMGTPVKIVDLAKRMIELAGLQVGRDIEIVYTGLRPGEKLFEELLAQKENTLPTPNMKIFRARVREYDYEQVASQIKSLCEVAMEGESVEVVTKMKGIVPEYKSQNSEYERLDSEPKRSDFTSSIAEPEPISISAMGTHQIL